jgi:hypothetical protein
VTIDTASWASLMNGRPRGSEKHNPTAICVAEIDKRQRRRRQVNHFVVRHLERLPLGTSYPTVAHRLAEVSAGIRQRTDRRPYLYVDATGMGQPIIHLLRTETTGLGSIKPVYFTYGDQRTEEGGQVRLGKAYLVSRLQVLLQMGRLHLPRTAESETLAQEFLDYEIEVDENANDRYGAFRVGTHDDLVTAVGLAVQTDKPHPGVVSGACKRSVNYIYRSAG